MEIKIFIKLLIKRWWIIVVALVMTVFTTLYITNLQPSIYSSSETFVVSPSSDVLNGTGFLSGLSVLGGQPTVTNTYASIAASASVKQKASEALGLTPVQSKNLVVATRVQTATNVIEIAVEGQDPLLVQAFTIKIGESTMDYVSTLKGVFSLKMLDSASSPEEPIRPNRRLNLVLGVALGLLLGVGIAFLTGLKDY